MVGRHPKPTAIKIQEGNPGHRPLNKHEPKFTGIPTCPQHLTKVARKEWRRVTKELSAAGLLSAVDRAALAVYCSAWARWIYADELASKSEVIRTKAGNIILNPLRSTANRAEEIMLKAAVEFGMTPSSRSRVTADDKNTAGMELNAILMQERKPRAVVQ
jgi:P27 family predicted phage terminase small subunit